jgi:hypothetical protein
MAKRKKVKPRDARREYKLAKIETRQSGRTARVDSRTSRDAIAYQSGIDPKKSTMDMISSLGGKALGIGGSLIGAGILQRGGSGGMMQTDDATALWNRPPTSGGGAVAPTSWMKYLALGAVGLVLAWMLGLFGRNQRRRD